MTTLPFSKGECNPRTNTATGCCRKKLYTCKSSAVKLQIQQSTTPSASISRREAAIGLGFCFSFLQLLNPQQDSAAANEVTSLPCEFAAASSGLEYCDKVIGTGPEPVKGQLIKVVWKLENGKVFDSSYDKGKPLTFRVGVEFGGGSTRCYSSDKMNRARGWDVEILGGDGIPAMSAGGKRKLRIPLALGYGIRGAGCRGGSCTIRPDSVLLFDVEFIGKA